jgi:hypothetical protein
MNKLIKTITADKLSYEFLHSLNGIIGLTERELQILALFLDLSTNKQKGQKKSVDCTENRKAIMSSTGVTRDNLSRYIKIYKNRGLFKLNKDTKCWEFNNAIIPIVIGGKTVQITLILKINENDGSDKEHNRKL